MINEEKVIIDTVKKLSPAVVSVIISKHLPKIKKTFMSPFGPFQLPGSEEKDDKTEKSAGEKDKEGHPKEQHVQIGGGSGFVVHSNSDYSLILTNKHVVHDREAEYTVLIEDPEGQAYGAGKEHEAEVLSNDPINDIAILKIKAAGLPILDLGDSSKIQIGQTVIAIGTALGMFTNSVSKGIISGLSRRIAASLGEGQQTEVLRGVIQTDVAINQGNSGGPLISSDGKVIGINTAIIFGAQNIGFAIPINWAKRDLEDILKYGKIERPYLGLRYLMLNEKIQKQYGFETGAGALVVSDHLPDSKAVIPDSPADKAGIRENDVITAVNGKELDEKAELADLIQDLKVGDEVEMDILREGKEKVKTKVKLEEMK